MVDVLVDRQVVALEGREELADHVPIARHLLGDPAHVEERLHEVVVVGHGELGPPGAHLMGVGVDVECGLAHV